MHILYVPLVGIGFARKTVTKGYHQKGLVETIPTICDGFYPKSDVEVMAFQRFWYELIDKHKMCIFVCALLGRFCWTKPSQRETIGNVSSRRF